MRRFILLFVFILLLPSFSMAASKKKNKSAPVESVDDRWFHYIFVIGDSTPYGHSSHCLDGKTPASFTRWEVFEENESIDGVPMIVTAAMRGPLGGWSAMRFVRGKELCETVLKADSSGELRRSHGEYINNRYR